MALVMLARGGNGTFRRSVRDDDGKVTRTLTFEPGVPQELSGADLKAVQDDIGKALVLAELDEKGRPRAKSGEEGDALRHAVATTNSHSAEHAESAQRLAEEGPHGEAKDAKSDAKPAKRGR